MQLNTEKTNMMEIYFGKKSVSTKPININGKQLKHVSVFKMLGVMINNRLTWCDHVDYICGKAAKRLYFLCLLRRAGKPPKDIVTVFCSVIRSVLEYACEVWHPGLTQEQSDKIEHLQKRALRIAYPDQEYKGAMEIAGLIPLHQRREARCLNFFTNLKKEDHKLHYLLPEQSTVKNLRSCHEYRPPLFKTERFKKSPINYGLVKFQGETYCM